jgi:hypothetical protein
MTFDAFVYKVRILLLYTGALNLFLPKAFHTHDVN